MEIRVPYYASKWHEITNSISDTGGQALHYTPTRLVMHVCNTVHGIVVDNPFVV